MLYVQVQHCDLLISWQAAQLDRKLDDQGGDRKKENENTRLEKWDNWRINKFRESKNSFSIPCLSQMSW